MAVSKLANRLATILHYLNRGYIVNIKELSEEFSISERQSQKDIELFSTMYEIESLGNQNYRMQKGFKIIGMENEDTEIAMALMKALQQSALPQMSEDIDKALPESKKYDNIFLFNLNYEEIISMREFHKLLQGINYQQSCEFTYRKKDGSTKKVYAHPYRIANFSNYWYLLAYDVEAEQLKSYHINSISKILLEGENYINNVAIEKEIEETFIKFNSPWFDGKGESVMLLVKGDAKVYLDRNCPKNTTILLSSTKSMEMEFFYYNETEVLSFVKKWLPDIEIIDNMDLQEKLYILLKNYIK
jgi:predicted DNA-binding transcriptional regulator YafY